MNKKFSFITRVALCIIATAVLLSCSPFTAPDRSTAHQKLPETFTLGNSDATAQEKWWLEFSSPQLNSLIDMALADNLTLRSYWARLERAYALSQKAGSGLMPSVSVDGSASYTESDSSGSGPSEEQRYALGLVAGYELDLWGRVRAGKRSADLAVSATREDLNAAAMTVAAEVARRWIGIVGSRQEKSLLLKQLEINKTYLELTELRFQKSLASALDVMQQRQLVERVNAQIPLVELRERTFFNELAVLTGRLPQELPEIARQLLPGLDSPPAGGVPVMLLENRPDVRAAFNRLQAADQDLVAARADRLPAIRITGSGGYNSSEFDRLFDNWLLNLAAGLTAPLVDGGRRKAEVEATTATVKEQLSQYRQTILTAVREVEDALVREQKTREHISRTKKQLEAAKIALSEAGSRYLNGLSDYLPVLTQLLSVQNLEQDLVNRNVDLLGARISLYRSIGGTWPGSLSQPETTTEIQQDDQS